MLVVLRVRGILGPDALRGATALPESRLEQMLRDLEAASAVRYHGATPSGWSLTTPGRLRAEGLMARQVEQVGARAELLSAYERFLPLNRRVLQVCTDWQVRVGEDSDSGGEPGHTLNDHGDPSYDLAVLDRLSAIHREAEQLLSAMGAVLARFEPYTRRLANALDRAHRGELDWVTRPTVESYHTVWFQLHEDLLATLGRQRSDEEHR